MFSPKPDGQTDRYTDGRTYGRMDISIHRVASLVKNPKPYLIQKLCKFNFNIYINKRCLNKLHHSIITNEPTDQVGQRIDAYRLEKGRYLSHSVTEYLMEAQIK